MDKIVDEFLSIMKSMNKEELEETTKILNERLEKMISYKNDVETLEEKVLQKDKERYKALRKYEQTRRELCDIDTELKSIKEKEKRLETKRAKLKNDLLKYKQISDDTAKEFLSVKNKLKERRKIGINCPSTIKIRKKQEKITINSLEGKKIKINGATSITKINNVLPSRNTTNKLKL